ncbi:MAG TPA: hydroxyacid dehydrogenase [Candidatus Methylacidiphilales bacterium]|nr:hydroxyacid dehydrogenase [Candidatus Methylacidiphilales bacterium]
MNPLPPLSQIFQTPLITQDKEERVLFVITERERNLFFPDQLSNQQSALGPWVDSWSFKPASNWPRILSEMQPTVIVSAWTTPGLPGEWTDAPDCPLKYVCHLTGSVRRVVPRDLVARGVMVTNWGTSISHTIAEHAMLLVLSMLRNLPGWYPSHEGLCGNVAEKGLKLGTRSLRGRRVGLHGFGAIARELVQMLRPFQVELTAWSPNVPRSFYEEHGVTPAASLEELFTHSEVLIECEGLTPTTEGSVTEEILRLLPHDAVFVNVGRGAVTDESALIRLAAEGRIRVALDETVNEELKSAPGVMISPHLGGPTPDACRLCGELALSNVQKYLRGETPSGLMTLEVYDRST